MLVHIFDHDIEALSCLSQSLWVLVLVGRWWASHHDHIFAELHGRVIDFTVRSGRWTTVLPKAEGLGKKFQSSADIFVIKIGNDAHLNILLLGNLKKWLNIHAALNPQSMLFSGSIKNHGPEIHAPGSKSNQRKLCPACRFPSRPNPKKINITMTIRR